jgi:hypothetical protein
LLIHFPDGAKLPTLVFLGPWKYRLPADYSMGILPLPSRISILATGTWKVSQQYNGHDKIACFPGLRAWQRPMAPTT